MGQRLRTIAACSAAILTLGFSTAGLASAEPDPAVDVQLLSITDLHGYFGDYSTTVRETAGGPTQTVGGGAFLATHLRQAAEGHENSILFSGGDDFSGWPDETEWFWNEPTIEYLNHIGLEFSTIGNHEVDRGLSFLRHLTDGTCEGRPDDDLCFADSNGKQFAGADYDYYSANMIDPDSAKPLVAPSHVRMVEDGHGGEIPIGFVHASLRGVPNETMSYNPGTIAFTDETEAINAAVADLKAQGVRSIVAVVHEGFSQKTGAGYNDCTDPFGPMVDMNAGIDAEVDAVVTGHWHAQVNCFLPDPDGIPRPLVEAGNHGNLFSEINLSIDPATGDVLRDRTRSTLRPNTQDVTPDPGTLAITNFWKERLAERAACQVATLDEDLTRTPNALGESTLGNATAEAIQWAANQDGQADLAIVLPKTLQRDITVAPGSQAGDAPGTVLFGEVAVGTIVDSGIGHGVFRGDVQGRDLDTMLEAQWQQTADGSTTFQPLAVSGNVTYDVNIELPVGRRVSHLTLDGEPLSPGRTYRVASTSPAFMPTAAPAGFDAFTTAKQQDRSLFNGGDALWRWLEAQSPVAAPALDRARPRRHSE